MFRQKRTIRKAALDAFASMSISSGDKYRLDFYGIYTKYTSGMSGSSLYTDSLHSFSRLQSALL